MTCRLKHLRVQRMPCGKYFGFAAVECADSTEVWLFESSLRDTRDEAHQVAHAQLRTALRARQQRDRDR